MKIDGIQDTREIFSDLPLNKERAIAHPDQGFGQFLKKSIDDINSLQKQADILAERVVALGGFVPATAKLIAHYSTIEAFPEHPQGSAEFQKALILRFEQLAKSAHEALNKSDNLNDPVTTYHLTQTAAVIEQHLSVFEHAFAPAA